jgi:hypothetical protein
MRTFLFILLAASIGSSAQAGPFRRPTSRPTTCVGGACATAKAVTTAPVRVVRRVVGR